MLTYNTQLKKLVLPEYGRNIQRMVDKCLAIEDRNERTACAYSIVDVMQRMFPADGNAEDYRRKLWDHLAIMSDFSLDIDWPFEPIRPDSLGTAPDPVPLPGTEVPFRQYGNTLVNMIDVASAMPDGEEKDALVLLLANHMKKALLAVAPEGVDDEKVFKDLRYISHGALNLSAENTKLNEFKALPAPSKKKKKK